MHGRLLDEIENQEGNNIYPLPITWSECTDFLFSAIGVFAFLNDPGPTTAYINARDCMAIFLRNQAAFLDFSDTGESYSDL